VAKRDHNPIRSCDKALLHFVTPVVISTSTAFDSAASGTGIRQASRFERGGVVPSVSRRKDNTEGASMAERSGIGGISLGGILVIIGIVVAIFWSLLLGLIIALVGLIAFGGFARGRWY
jgi:hypothetical protein